MKSSRAGKFSQGLAWCLLAHLGILACTPPRGSSGGRLDPAATAPSERNSSGLNLADMYGFADRTAEQLVAEILSNPQIASSKYRVTIELGMVENKGTDMKRSDSELFLERVKSRLTQSRKLKDIAAIKQPLSRAQSQAQQLGGKAEDVDIDIGSDRQVYTLNGTFYMAERGGVRRYFSTFALVDAQTREIIFESSFDQAEGS
jgi:hypothetical protein